MTRASDQAASEAFKPSFLSSPHIPAIQQPSQDALSQSTMPSIPQPDPYADVRIAESATGQGVLIGMLSAFGSAAIVALVLLVIYFFQYTQRGRILLDRLARPGEFDDEQAFLREEADALELMDDMERMEYLRAKAFIQANPPESVQTDISLSQFLAIQEKGVSAWEFEPELEIANCFVEGRTEIEFFDSECSVQSNLPVPKQNEVYYWEAKIYDKPENTLISIGMTTKPYPLFRLPGYHKHSIAYLSNGLRRHNQPFTATAYAPEYQQGDVVGVGYRPRTGTVFFTRNGKKLEDVAHGLKTHNFFPTVGANGPCQVHVNFGQLGFVFIEANVKKWGLAPMTGSLAPPPPYGSEQGSILLEGGRDAAPARDSAAGAYTSFSFGHSRSASAQARLSRTQPVSPGPQRSPTDISLAQLSLVDSREASDDLGEGTSSSAAGGSSASHNTAILAPTALPLVHPGQLLFSELGDAPPPDYESPHASPDAERRRLLGAPEDDRHDTDSDGSADEARHGEARPLRLRLPPDPPIPSYDDAVGDGERARAGR